MIKKALDKMNVNIQLMIKLINCSLKIVFKNN